MAIALVGLKQRLVPIAATADLNTAGGAHGFFEREHQVSKLRRFRTNVAKAGRDHAHRF
jgi:hypothetical protein